VKDAFPSWPVIGSDNCERHRMGISERRGGCSWIGDADGDTTCVFACWETSGIMDDFVAGRVGCIKEGISRCLGVVV
jgi:hypothetical protein